MAVQYESWLSHKAGCMLFAKQLEPLMSYGYHVMQANIRGFTFSRPSKKLRTNTSHGNKVRPVYFKLSDLL